MPDVFQRLGVQQALGPEVQPVRVGLLQARQVGVRQRPEACFQQDAQQTRRAFVASLCQALLHPLADAYAFDAADISHVSLFLEACQG